MSTWPTDIEILDLAKPFVKAREGFRERPYLDQAGVPTIGYGTTRYPNGREVSMSDSPVDTGYAEVCLTAAMTRMLDDLKAAETRVPTAHEAAAILSLAYNMGSGRIAKSTLMRLFNEGDIKGAAEQFLRWDHVREHGKMVESEGLLKRRRMEREMFLTAD